MGEIVVGISSLVAVLKAVKEAIDAATGVVESIDKFVVTLRKTVDDFKNTVTEVVVTYDSDGDGENDTEEVVYKIYQTLPDYETGFCICNKGSELGLGMPMFEIIDGKEFPNLLVEAPAPAAVTSETSDALPAVVQDYPAVTGTDKYFLVDLYNDGYNDVVSPAADITGDGINDWLVVVDNDGDGLPDASPNAAFYPVGSDGFNELVGYGDDDLALTKPFAHYSVTEGLLFLLVVCSILTTLFTLFRRRKL